MIVVFSKSRSPSHLQKRTKDLPVPKSWFTNFHLYKLSSSKSNYEIIDIEVLNNCLSIAAICKECKNPSSRLFIRQSMTSFGLGKKIEILCSTCNKANEFYTSKRSSSSKIFDVTARSVYASQVIGNTGLSELCSTMGLSQPVNKNR